MTSTDKLIRNWLIGFKGPVAGCAPYSERLYFKIEIWFKSIYEQDERRADTISIALGRRSSKLVRGGMDKYAAAQQAMGELWHTVTNEN